MTTSNFREKKQHRRNMPGRHVQEGYFVVPTGDLKVKMSRGNVAQRWGGWHRMYNVRVTNDLTGVTKTFHFYGSEIQLQTDKDPTPREALDVISGEAAAYYEYDDAEDFADAMGISGAEGRRAWSGIESEVRRFEALGISDEMDLITFNEQIRDR